MFNNLSNCCCNGFRTLSVSPNNLLLIDITSVSSASNSTKLPVYCQSVLTGLPIFWTFQMYVIVHYTVFLWLSSLLLNTIFDIFLGCSMYHYFMEWGLNVTVYIVIYNNVLLYIIYLSIISWWIFGVSIIWACKY